MSYLFFYDVSNRMVCQVCRSLNLGLPHNLNSFSVLSKRTSTSTNSFKDEDLLLFFKSDVQNILKRLTGLDLNKVFAQRKLGEKLEPPKFKFMTTKQVQEAQEKSRHIAEELLQMPPVVPVRKEINEVLSKDTEHIGLSESKFVFTDISFGKTDRSRTIVVRDQDGTLRKAFWTERRNANQTYFPRPGRQFKIPKMFQPEFLQPVLDRGDYMFVLDRACVEFDADDPEYHRVTQDTYNHIEEKQAYFSLRFTRHYGPFIFYLALSKRIDNLLLENLTTERLDDATALVSLYHLIHPTSKSSATKLQPGEEIAFIKDYIDKDSQMKVALELALMACSKPEAISVSN